ncbi:Swi5-domain-containing protein [Coniochaeta hoffmannii]|uniref:Swi5-domain-containing protein n=1 Tax=Coniochaeta hoffmannii TaxID=91930 RepID=A0AA38RR71_9PEZI|nr:Swi5-domain-containing protein [Coniochaeta hoffmannii]
MDGRNNTVSPLDGAIASFRTIVDGQMESIAELEAWLQERSASDKTYQAIASSLYPLLARNKARLLEARRTGVSSTSSGPSSWCTVSWSRTSANTVSVTCLGLDPQDRFDLQVPDGHVDSVENVVGLLANALDNLAATDAHMSRLARLIDDMEASAVRGPPGEIVHNHIRLLGQYNEAKDIAQQLIGLIADNRGVPVGSLYQDDRYGVGPDD